MPTRAGPPGARGRGGLRRALLAVGAGLCLLPVAFAGGAGGEMPQSAAPLALPLPAGRDDLSVADRARVVAVTAPATVFDRAEPFEAMAGGAATSVAAPDANAFSHPSANLTFDARERFFLGNGLFRKVWVSSPASTAASDGLGPLFNARACQRCHLKDGRGRPPAPGERASSLLLRLSVPPATARDRAALADFTLLRIPEPRYGGQLQTFAVPGLPAEGQVAIVTEELVVPLADGEEVRLERPSYAVVEAGYGPLSPDLMVSPRVAPPMIGVGLLEAVHPADIAALADPDDADGDGISGRLSLSRDPQTGDLALGRFGWKASVPTIKAQAAEAFGADIGISTPLVTDAFGECSLAQTLCREMPTGVQARLGEVEAPDPVLDLVAFYSRHLAVPERRDVGSAGVLEGKRLFYAAGCPACHRPKFVTRSDAPDAALRFQLVWPYTDLLLHDMGEGLADGRPVGSASGREWRTAPLWGIGLTETVNGHTRFLHDGRARSLLEAILWHGGEAEAATQRVREMSAQQRAALLRFLESL